MRWWVRIGLAVLVGLAIGVFAKGVLNCVLDRSDWRARELSGWCNEYRVIAQQYRERIARLSNITSNEFPNSMSWLLHASEADYARGEEILSIQRRAMAIEPWFIRCATSRVPELPLGDDMPAIGHDLVRYFDAVVANTPVRDIEDANHYVGWLEEPERHFALH